MANTGNAAKDSTESAEATSQSEETRIDFARGVSPTVEGCQSPEAITLYTAQAGIVLDTMRAEGVYRVKMAYVDQKYGEQSWIFREAYSFFVQNASRILPPPEGAQTAIWAYADELWAGASAGSWVLKLQVPRDRVVLFDLRAWNKILNLSYIGEDDADERRFQDRLSSMGIQHATQAFSTPFYPQVKQEIRKSWQRLFGSADACPTTYVQAGLWELRPEWVVEARQS